MDGFNPSAPKCSECGLFHPPVAEGEKCPMSQEKTKSGDIIDFNLLFSPLKNICISQIQSKNIKDHKKLFNFVIIELTKLLENYKEKQ